MMQRVRWLDRLLLALLVPLVAASHGSASTCSVESIVESCQEASRPAEREVQIWRTLLECNLQLEQSADTPETPATDGAIPTPPHPAAPPTPSAAADSLPQLSASGTVLATITTRAIQAFTVEFNRAYNMNVTLSPVAYSAFNEQQLSEFPTRERPGSADFWFVGAEALADGTARGSFVDLTVPLQLDAGFQLSEIPIRWRNAMSPAFSGSFTAVPVVLSTRLLHYRRDLFAQHQLPLPHTWEDVLQLAEWNAANNVTEYGFCFDSSTACGGSDNYVSFILSSIVQARGPSDGTWFDPSTLQPLFLGAAMRRALQLAAQLRSYSVPDSMPCNEFISALYITGKCLMSWGHPLLFKLGSHVSVGSPMRGRTGLLATPGSAQVLDRGTGQLAPCTRERCPMATPVLRPDGSEVLVNKVTPVESASWAINAFSPLARQAVAFVYLARVMGSENHKRLVLQLNELPPLRSTELRLEDWVAAGFERGDAAAFLDQWQASLNAGNVLYELRLPGASDVQGIIQRAADGVLFRGRAPEAALAEAQAEVEQYLRVNDRSRLLQLYRRSLGLTLPQPNPDRQQPTTTASESHRGHGALTVGLAVGLGCAAATICIPAVLFGWIWLRNRARRCDRLGSSTRQSAPGVGPQTTLLVTDIQDSTKMWEALPAEVCDAAVKLHHRIIRELLVAHSGYESATEGDSFILAFRDPWDALRFALAAQDALLAAPWPQQLLDSDVTPTLAVSYSHMQYKRYAPWISCTRLLAAMGKRGGGGGGGGQRAGPQPWNAAPASLHSQRPSIEVARESSIASRVRRNRSGAISSPAASDSDGASGPQRSFQQGSSQQLHQHASRLSMSSLACTGTDPGSPTFGRVSREHGSRCAPSRRPTLSPSGSVNAATIPYLETIPRHSHGLTSGGSTPPLDSPNRCSSDGASISPSGWASPHGADWTQPKPRTLSSPQQSLQSGHGGVAGALPGSQPPPPTSPRVQLSAVEPHLALAAHDRPSPFASITVALQQHLLSQLQGQQKQQQDVRRSSLNRRNSSRKLLGHSALGSPSIAGSSRLPAVRDTGSSCGDHSHPADPPSQRLLRLRHQVQSVPSGNGLRLPRRKGAELAEGEGMVHATLPLAEVLRRVFPTVPAQGHERERPAFGKGRQVIFRGLRVRMGLHSGVRHDGEMQYNRASQRTVYRGAVLHVAKAVGDFGQGGQVALSSAALAALGPGRLAAEGGCLLLHSGRHLVKEEMQMDIFSVFRPSLLPRACYLTEPRSIRVMSAGCLSSPLGHVAVGVAQLDDALHMGGWGLEVAALSQRCTREVAAWLAAEHKGFLLHTRPGTLEAVFSCPWDAARWLLELQEAVGPMRARLARQLHRAGQGKGRRPGAGGGGQQQQEEREDEITSAVLMEALDQGHAALRVKGGLDVGPLPAMLAYDGRLSYHGAPAKAAARFAAHAQWGELLASVAAVRAMLPGGHPARALVDSEVDQLLAAPGTGLTPGVSERSRGPPRRRGSVAAAISQLVGGASGLAAELAAGLQRIPSRAPSQISMPGAAVGTQRPDTSPALSRAASVVADGRASEVPASCSSTRSILRSQTCIRPGSGRAAELHRELEQHLARSRPLSSTGSVAVRGLGHCASDLGAGVASGDVGVASQGVEEGPGLSEVVGAWEAAIKVKSEAEQQEEARDAALKQLQQVLRQPSLISTQGSGLQQQEQQHGRGGSAVAKRFRRLFRVLTPDPWTGLGGSAGGGRAGGSGAEGKWAPSASGSVASGAVSPAANRSRHGPPPAVLAHRSVSRGRSMWGLGSPGDDGGAAAAGGDGATGSSGGCAPARPGFFAPADRSRFGALSRRGAMLSANVEDTAAHTLAQVPADACAPAAAAAGGSVLTSARPTADAVPRSLESETDANRPLHHDPAGDPPGPSGGSSPPAHAATASLTIGTLELADVLLQPPGKVQAAARLASPQLPAPQVPPAVRHSPPPRTSLTGTTSARDSCQPLPSEPPRPPSGRAPSALLLDPPLPPAPGQGLVRADAALPVPGRDAYLYDSMPSFAANVLVAVPSAPSGEVPGPVSSAPQTEHSSSRSRSLPASTPSNGPSMELPIPHSRDPSYRRGSLRMPEGPCSSSKLAGHIRNSVSGFMVSTELVELTAMHIQQEGVQLSEAVLAAARGTAGASRAHASRPLEFRPLAAAPDSLYGTLEPSAKPEPAARGSTAGREEEEAAAAGAAVVDTLGPTMGAVAAEAGEEVLGTAKTGSGEAELTGSIAGESTSPGVRVDGLVPGGAVVARTVGRRGMAPWLALPWGRGLQHNTARAAFRPASEGGDVLMAHARVASNAGSARIEEICATSVTRELAPPPLVASAVSPEVAVAAAGSAVEGVRFGEVRLVKTKGTHAVACSLHKA